MKLYTVKYKKAGSLFWKTIKNVKGDGFIDESSGFYSQIPGTSIASFAMKTNNQNRWFVLEDETRIELDPTGLIIKFSKDRFLLIHQRAQSESGQTLSLNKR